MSEREHAAQQESESAARITIRERIKTENHKGRLSAQYYRGTVSPGTGLEDCVWDLRCFLR